MNAAQCRAARALLGWSSNQLAQAAHLEPAAVRHFEDGGAHLPSSALFNLSQALESTGIEFMLGPSTDFGVRMRRGLRPLQAPAQRQMS